MDARALLLLIENRAEWEREAYARCAAILADDGKLPGMARDMPGGADYDTAGDVGEALEAMVKQYARDVYGWEEDGTDPGDLTAQLFFTAVIDHTNWRDAGALFYPHVRERWADAAGVDAYPG